MSETIKVVIEISKDYYEILKCEVEENQTDYYPFIVIGNGIPLDEVLDKISAEIKEVQNMTSNDKGYEEGWKEALRYSLLQLEKYKGDSE